REQSEDSEQFLQRPEIHTQWESDYLNRDMERFYDLAFGEIIQRLQPKPTDTLLDAGCGFGYHTVRLARSKAHITAVDFSDVALAAARKKLAEDGTDTQGTLDV